jgi:hypothetical protein
MDGWQIFRAAMAIAPRLLGFQDQGYSEETDPNLITDKDLALITLKRKTGSVTVVIGTRDTGKTELCYRLAEFLERPTYAVSPQQKPPSWIKWLHVEDVLEQLPPDSTCIFDDTPAYMSNRDYNESFNRTVEKAIPMVRHDPHPPDFPIGRVHLIFSTQSAAQADRYILDVDAAFFKPLGLLMGDIERPNIAKLYRTLVNPEFDGQSEDFIKSHAYMLTRGYKGLIEVAMTR